MTSRKRHNTALTLEVLDERIALSHVVVALAHHHAAKHAHVSMPAKHSHKAAQHPGKASQPAMTAIQPTFTAGHQSSPLVAVAGPTGSATSTENPVLLPPTPANGASSMILSSTGVTTGNVIPSAPVAGTSTNGFAGPTGSPTSTENPILLPPTPTNASGGLIVSASPVAGSVGSTGSSDATTNGFAGPTGSPTSTENPILLPPTPTNASGGLIVSGSGLA